MIAWGHSRGVMAATAARVVILRNWSIDSERRCQLPRRDSGTTGGKSSVDRWPVDTRTIAIDDLLMFGLFIPILWRSPDTLLIAEVSTAGVGVDTA